MNAVFVIVTLLWLMEFIIFPSKDKVISEKANSFYVILFSILLVVLINIVMLHFDKYILENFTLKIIALILYSIGLILRYYSLILLGKNFSRNVEVSKDQNLVSGGIYKYIRHPLYLGLFLLVVSIPLYSGNIILFLVSIILMFTVIDIRIKEEEKTMEEIIGKRYVDWKNERHKFIPFIY